MTTKLEELKASFDAAYKAANAAAREETYVAVWAATAAYRAADAAAAYFAELKKQENSDDH
jgi:hypothetical protein